MPDSPTAHSSLNMWTRRSTRQKQIAKAKRLHRPLDHARLGRARRSLEWSDVSAPPKLPLFLGWCVEAHCKRRQVLCTSRHRSDRDAPFCPSAGSRCPSDHRLRSSIDSEYTQLGWMRMGWSVTIVLAHHYSAPRIVHVIRRHE